MKTRTIVEYALAALLVLILGSLAGWFFFLRGAELSTIAQDSARGYGTRAPLPNVNGIPSGGESSSARPGNQGREAQAQTGEGPPAGPGFFSRVYTAIFGGSRAGIPASLPVSPFGEGSPASALGTVLSGNTPSATTTSKRPPQFWHVAATPVAGMTFVNSAAGVRVRYVERRSGYIFEADPERGEVQRLTNTLMPKIYEAIFTQGRIIERSLDDAGQVTTFVGSISTSTPAASGDTSASLRSLSGLYLEKGIRELAADPKSDQLFYLIPAPEGVVGIRSEWNGTKQKRIFTSAVTDWRVAWLTDGRIILSQAAGDDVPGYAYELKSTGTISPLLRVIPGLTILPRASSPAILYGTSEGGTLSLLAHAALSAKTARLPIKTITDKCVWAPDVHRENTSDSKSQSPSGAPGTALIAYCGVPQTTPTGAFLNNWYRGAVHSSDALWRVDASAGSAELTYTPDANTSIDIENPVMDASGMYIAFMNAADKSLWILRLEK